MTEKTVIAPAEIQPQTSAVVGAVRVPRGVRVGEGGAPSCYQVDFPEKARSYFDDPSIANDVVPTMAGLACFLGVARSKLYEYLDLDPAFRDAVNYGKSQTERQLANRVVQKETFTPGQIFALKNLVGWSDRNESRFEESAATLLTALAGAVSLPMVKQQGQTVEGEQVREQLPEGQADSDYGQTFDLYATGSEKLE